MKTKVLFLGSLLLAVAMAGFAVLTADRLPPDAVLPVHWNFAGQADRHAPALQALLWPAGLVAGLAVILAAIPRIEPLQDRLEQSAPVLRVAWIGVLGILAFVQLTIGLPAWGIVLPVNAILVVTGIVFLVLGNILPKSRPGFFVGIRTPWTLTSTDVWIATHRLGGKLMMLAGGAIILAGLLPIQPKATAIVALTSIGFAALVPIVYSWWLWRRGKDESSGLQG